MMISSYLYSLSNSIPKYGIITDEENYLSLEDQNSINEELETINVDYNLNGYFIIVSSLNSCPAVKSHVSGLKQFLQ